eukprot:768647-Hanusia_phi.AAC.3
MVDPDGIFMQSSFYQDKQLSRQAAGASSAEVTGWQAGDVRAGDEQGAQARLAGIRDILCHPAKLRPPQVSCCATRASTRGHVTSRWQGRDDSERRLSQGAGPDARGPDPRREAHPRPRVHAGGQVGGASSPGTSRVCDVSQSRHASLRGRTRRGAARYLRCLLVHWSFQPAEVSQGRGEGWLLLDLQKLDQARQKETDKKMKHSSHDALRKKG